MITKYLYYLILDAELLLLNILLLVFNYNSTCLNIITICSFFFRDISNDRRDRRN